MPKGVYIKSEQHGKNLSKSLKGHLVSGETRRKISIKNKGKKRTEEFKENDRLTHLREKNSMFGKFGKKHPTFGKHWKWTEESKETLRKNHADISGEKHPNWKGGISFEKYTIDWTVTLRRSIRERDHYICQLCSTLQGDKAHSVHHIDYDKKNCDPKNLITLCIKCSSKVNFNREYWKEYFEKKMSSYRIAIDPNQK